MEEVQQYCWTPLIMFLYELCLLWESTVTRIVHWLSLALVHLTSVSVYYTTLPALTINKVQHNSRVFRAQLPLSRLEGVAGLQDAFDSVTAA